MRDRSIECTELCLVLWICNNKLQLFPCGCQLLPLLFLRVGHKIKKEDIVCQNLMMEIFIQCGIVEKATSVKTLLTLLKICETFSWLKKFKILPSASGISIAIIKKSTFLGEGSVCN